MRLNTTEGHKNTPHPPALCLFFVFLARTNAQREVVCQSTATIDVSSFRHQPDKRYRAIQYPRMHGVQVCTARLGGRRAKSLRVSQNNLVAKGQAVEPLAGSCFWRSSTSLLIVPNLSAFPDLRVICFSCQKLHRSLLFVA